MIEIVVFTVVLILLGLIIYFFYKRGKKWESTFLEGARSFFVQYHSDPELTRRVARLLLLADYMETPYPKKVRQFLEKWAEKETTEVWREYGL